MLNWTSRFCIIMTKTELLEEFCGLAHDELTNTQICAVCYEVNNQFKTCVFNIIHLCFSFLNFALFKETYSDFTQFLYVHSPSFTVTGKSLIPKKYSPSQPISLLSLYKPYCT